MSHKYTFYLLKIRLLEIPSAFFIFVFSALNVYAAEVGALYYDRDIAELEDSTILAPAKAIVLSSAVNVSPCTTCFFEDIPRSIFFIIDHSGYMFQQNQGARDRWGQRFTFAQAFIDTIRKVFPIVEIGVAVFRQFLYFDPADNKRFIQSPGNDTGAYLPFFRCDSLYTPEGKYGYQIVKELLDTVIRTDSTGYLYADLKYKPSNAGINDLSTNINAGFDAVKHAFKSAASRPKRHFVIFLSGGDATVANGPHSNAWDYRDSVAGVPTTFTHYVTTNNTVPQNLSTMTLNIKNNGYSSMNCLTSLYTYRPDCLKPDTVLQFLLVSDFLKFLILKPVDITLNGNSATNYDSINCAFRFGNYFPFTGITSSFNYKINYTGTRDSITLNNDTVVIQKDSTRQGSFNVNIHPGVNLPPHFSLYCWDRALGLYYKNNPVLTVNKTMDTLEIRFTEKKVDTLYNYDTVSVTITNLKGTNTDSETFKLTKTDSCFHKLFTIAIDSTPIKNDGILQVYEEDTIIATFRNTKLPLDTLRLAVPFKANTGIQLNTIISNGRFSFNLVKNGNCNYCLKYNNLPSNGMVTLYNVNGRAAFKKQINKGSSAISLPGTLSPGLYILQVNYGRNCGKKKVVLQ